MIEIQHKCIVSMLQVSLGLISEVTKSIYSVRSLSSLFYPHLCALLSFSASLFVPVCFYQCVSLHLCLCLPCWVSHCITARLSLIFLYLHFSHYLLASLYPSVFLFASLYFLHFFLITLHLIPSLFLSVCMCLSVSVCLCYVFLECLPEF